MGRQTMVGIGRDAAICSMILEDQQDTADVENDINQELLSEEHLLRRTANSWHWK